MQTRNSLNSQIFKEKFPSVYRDFFAKCPLVISSPHFFTWAGEYVGYFGGVMALQKIPFRIYIGAEDICPTAEKQPVVFAKEAKSFSLKENKFKQDQFELLANERLLVFINRFVKENRQKTGAFRIHLLSEMPFGSSGSSGALCSALSLLLLLKTEKITSQEIENWQNYPSKELLENKKLKFALALNLAWQLMAVYRGKETSAGTLFVCLKQSQNPVFYYLKKQSNVSWQTNESPEEVAKASFSAGCLEDIFQINKNISWPLDFALLFLGEPRGTSSYSVSRPRSQAKAIYNFSKKHFPKAGLNVNKNLWQTNLQALNFLSCQLIMALGNVLNQSASEEELQTLFKAVNKHQALFLILDVMPGAAENIAAVIKTQARKLNELGAGIKSVSTTKKDILLVVFPHGQTRNCLLPALSQIKKTLGLDLYLGYASWLDGLEKTPAKIEQFLEKNLFSQFVVKGSVFVKVFQENKKPALLTLSPSTFEKEKNKTDILLDEINNKIYLKGRALTSKELHSSKAAIALLKAFLEKQSQLLNNQDLPESAYAKDRYELQSKIALPLARAIEKTCQKKITFRISGQITNFNVRFALNNLTCWLKQ